jgi:hypothetical protein
MSLEGLGKSEKLIHLIGSEPVVQYFLSGKRPHTFFMRRSILGLIYDAIGESSLDDRTAQVFPYNIFIYCSICRVDCKFARNKKKLWRH